MKTQTQAHITVGWLYERGWTCTQAAEKLGVDPTHLSRCLKGERQSRSLLMRIAQLPKQSLKLRRKQLA